MDETVTVVGDVGRMIVDSTSQLSDAAPFGKRLFPLNFYG